MNASKEQLIKMMEDYHSKDPMRRAQAMIFLWDNINQFAMSYIHEKLPNISPDSFQDCLSEAKVTIFHDMERYDPQKGTLTTFFSYSLRHAVHTYLSKESNRLALSPSRNSAADAQIRQLPASDQEEDWPDPSPTPEELSQNKELNFRQ